MNKALLHSEVQEFISESLRADLHTLLLKGSPFPGISGHELVEQIESKKKAAKKLPEISSAAAIYYPNKRQLEQCSSEACATYKADIVRADTVFDLCGGFGVDTFYFSKTAVRVVYCERDRLLAAIAPHNFGQLGAENIETLQADGIDWLRATNNNADLIYLDPSRRTEEKNRVFLLAECSPNVPEHLDLLFEKSPVLLIKTSPLLDLQAGLLELGCVREIHVVALQNEVKELLWLMVKGFDGPVLVKTVNLGEASVQEFSFGIEEEKAQPLHISNPLAFLYEPNAALMKSGGFKTLGAQLGIPKLHEHSHLYTSEKVMDFPGRRFRVLKILPYSGKGLKVWHRKKANVSTRNFPASVASIRKRFNISDGGNLYLFFTKGPQNDLIVLECEKI